MGRHLGLSRPSIPQIHYSITRSTPAATAFDLVGYHRQAGGLSNVATLLTELAERLANGLLAAEVDRSPLPWTQRLGHLLELIGHQELARSLAECAARAREYVPLRPGAPTAATLRDRRWRLLVNEPVEPDL